MYHILYVASSSRRTKGARAWTEAASRGDRFGSTAPTLSKTVLVGVGGTLGADAVANVARPRLPGSDAGVPADAARGPNAGTLTKVASRAAAITTQRMGAHGVPKFLHASWNGGDNRTSRRIFNDPAPHKVAIAQGRALVRPRTC